MNKKVTTLLFIIAGTMAVLPATSAWAGELRNPQPSNYQGQSANYQGQPTSYQGQSANYQGQSTSYQGQSTNYQEEPATYEGQICTKYKYFTVGEVQPNGCIIGTYRWLYKIPIKGGYKILPDGEDQGGTETLPNTFGGSFNPGDTFNIDNGYLPAGGATTYIPSSNPQSGAMPTKPENLH